MKKYTHLTVIVLILFQLLSVAKSQKLERQEAVAAYIYNFAKNIHWQDENSINVFKFLVIGDADDVSKELNNLSKTKKLRDKPIKIISSPYLKDIDNINLIYLPNNQCKNIIELYDKIEGKNILLVSDGCEDKRFIMINLYEKNKNQLSFEINKANIINQNLSFDSELLLIGGTEIDVASLYRKSQYNLRTMQKNIDKISDSLKNLQTNIQSSINLINEQQTAISRQKILLEEQLNKIKNDEDLIKSQRGILVSQQKAIDNKNQILKDKLNELKKEQDELECHEQILKNRQKQIEELNKEIKGKNLILGSQSETIVKQKQLLYLSIIVGILIVSLVIAIYIGYRKNKQKSQILASQKREIGRKLNEVEKLNEQLKSADQYKSIFLASMSHELRTPLNSIIGYTGILLMGMTGQLNDEQIKQLNKIKNNSKHLLSLINDILDISKIEADKVELQIEDFNLRDLINQIVEIIYPKAVEKNLELTASVKDDLIISSDVRRIKQVIINLVTNAVNYSETGKIDIKAEKLSDKNFRVSVKDTGIGISEEDMQRLFQPFQQIDTTLTKKTSGTGLGLYLCRKLMKLLGGDIFVKSELGKGSEFYIEMPIKNN